MESQPTFIPGNNLPIYLLDCKIFYQPSIDHVLYLINDWVSYIFIFIYRFIHCLYYWTNDFINMSNMNFLPLILKESLMRIIT
jgi:hypothetical protein